MSLTVSIGQLAFLLAHDPKEVGRFRKALRAVNRVLTAKGLPTHNEPESLPELVDRAPVLGSIPYGWLQYTRRAVAYAMRPGKRFRPLDDEEDPSADPMYDALLSSSDSHIICHSDCEGFYVPIDFPKPLYDPLPDSDPDVIRGGGILGSSQGGLRELVLAAPLLDIPLKGGRLSVKEARVICAEEEDAHPHWVARQAWLFMYERLRQSIEYGAAAVFA
jgi:hypothetical protein